MSEARYDAQGPQILRDGKPYVTILADAPEHMEAARVIAGVLASLFELRRERGVTLAEAMKIMSETK